MAQFDAPIPGQGMTVEPNSRPWKRPPQFSDVDTVIEFYIPRIYKKIDQLIPLLEQGNPIVNIVHPLTMAGVMKGIHSVDVAVLVNDILVDFIAALADKIGVEYKVGIEEPPRDDIINGALDIVSAMPTEADEEQAMDVQESVGSLMTRRSMPDGV